MQFLRRLRPTFSRRSTFLALLTIIFLSLFTLLGVFTRAAVFTESSVFTSVPSFELLENRAIDIAFNLRGPVEPLPALDEQSRPRLDGDGNPESLVVIVAIDDESFAQTQLSWPWPRAYMAQIINQIAKGQPKSITADIFWYEPGFDPGGDEALAQAIADAGNVILANDLNRIEVSGYITEQFRRPLTLLEDAALHTGLANLQRDPADGYVRQMPLYLISPIDHKAYFSWSALTTLTYLGAPIPTSIGSDVVQMGDTVVPITSGFVTVNYLGQAGSRFNQVQAYQVASGEVYDQFGADYFKDKIVLIGATSVALQDVYPTPFQGNRLPMPGVEVNAHVIDTILSQRFVTRWPVLAGVAAVITLGLIAYIISSIPIPGLSLTLIVLTAIAYLVFWYVAFVQFRTEVYMVAPIFSLILGYAVPSVERAISEQLEKRRVRGIFERFVSPEMVEQMIGHGLDAARGKRTELTVLFSDIRGFTTMSEKMAPDEVVDLLNEYLGVMTDVLHKYGGTIDKYEGDLIMAFFNAPIPQPDHAKRAVAAAIDMRLTLDQLKARWAKDGARPTNFEMGIGLNTGDAFVGLIGSERRINYTCIGDSVNLASRVQDLTKDLQWPLLITEFTYAFVKDHFDCEFADSVMVKGKTKPVGMFRVIGRKGAPESERIRPLFA
jgi:adenylate cyclase